MPSIHDVLDSKEELLFHYTTMETALEHILPSSMLRLSPLGKLPDPKENTYDTMAGVNFDYDSSFPTSELKKIVQERTKIACFSLDEFDGPFAQKSSNFRGYAKSRMWDQYADGHKGVCLVFSKQKLIELFKQKFRSARKIMDKVVYKTYFQGFDNLDGGNFKVIGRDNWLEQFVKLNHEKIFLEKMMDYCKEDEYRLGIISDKDGYEHFEFKGAMLGIIRGFRVPEHCRCTLNDFAEELGIPLAYLRYTCRRFMVEDDNISRKRS